MFKFYFKTTNISISKYCQLSVKFRLHHTNNSLYAFIGQTIFIGKTFSIKPKQIIIIYTAISNFKLGFYSCFFSSLSSGIILFRNINILTVDILLYHCNNILRQNFFRLNIAHCCLLNFNIKDKQWL